MSSQVCFMESALRQTVVQSFIVLVAAELFLYGILYVIATLIFFILATISVSLDLAWRSVNAFALIVEEPDVASVFVGGPLLDVKLQSGPYYIYVIAGLLATWCHSANTPLLPSMELKKICHYFAFVGPNRNLQLGDEADQAAFITDSTVYRVYVLITLGENLILTGLMAGRVWSLDHGMKKILIGGKKKISFSQSLLGPILQFGALNPIFLTIWVIINLTTGMPVNEESQFITLLTPCALTQIVGIASTLIVVSIGISSGSDSQSHMSNEENRSLLVLESLELDPTSTGRNIPQTHDSVRPSADTIQPFLLKYDNQRDLSTVLSSTAHGKREAQQ
ncbi:hypothetical protein BDP27DRAFT_1542585 [Rhodocollybia butyracea]|uniref:Uncharacterized protein n=1 Tax=Rhodocollybia butyracea TaxID=206335 RepID=A0A9P5PJF6_9AGAR|nr:hypothetical protein BDP27DRAFT_1542585 [Rhodocollybia butyracea]